MDPVIIDVREQDEFDAEHVPGSIWVPLSQFARLAPGVLQAMAGKDILIMCRSGKRSAMAQTQIRQLGFGELKTEVFAGGILEWKNQGRPVHTGKACHIPILRQVQLVVGPVVLVCALLSLLVDVRFAWGAALFGAGLSFAGATGSCPLAEVLGRMPWNAGPKR
ncbi:MAG: rhodanese-like domain-containing protein [Elusimicrobiota bacterium]|jgi:rhodanese-related sulfurtransferase